MIKQKLKFWGVICFFAACAYIMIYLFRLLLFSQTISLLLFGQTIPLNVSINGADEYLKNNIVECDYSYKLNEDLTINADLKYLSSDSSIEPDMIINKSDSTSESNKPGYKYYPKMFYSPIVCYVDKYCYKNSSDWNGYDNVKDNYYIDVSQVFEGLLEDKTWEDIGVDDNAAAMKGEIVVKIPNEKSEYHDDVLDFIKNNMQSDGLTDAQKDEKVQNIINKCESFNVGKWVENKKDLEKNEVIIAPEFYYMDTSNNVLITYGNKTNAVFYDVWLTNKTDSVKGRNNKEYTFDYAEDIAEMYRSDYDILKNVGLRVKNSTYDIFGHLLSKDLNAYIDIIDD